MLQYVIRFLCCYIVNSSSLLYIVLYFLNNTLSNLSCLRNLLETGKPFYSIKVQYNVHCTVG